MSWAFEGGKPLYIQLASRVRGRILDGTYAVGAQIPPVRTLAVEASVNPNTMQRALVELEEEGILETRGTVGRFVTADTEHLRRAAEESARAFAADTMRQAKEKHITKEALLRLLQESEDWQQ